MATEKLTDRQKQIKKLLDAGKTPGEVADTLGISVNGIYQARRRLGIKPTGKRGRPPKPATAQPKPSRKATSDPIELRDMTPLQAIRHRKQQVEASLNDKQQTLALALVASEKAQRAYDEARDKVKDELARLDRAEEALTSSPKPRKPRARAATPANGTQAAAQAASPESPPAQPPASTPASEPATVEEERPGAPTLPEFEDEPEFASGALVGADEFAQPDGFEED